MTILNSNNNKNTVRDRVIKFVFTVIIYLEEISYIRYLSKCSMLLGKFEIVKRQRKRFIAVSCTDNEIVRCGILYSDKIVTIAIM